MCFKACSVVDEGAPGGDSTYLFTDGFIVLYSNKNARWQHQCENTRFEKQHRGSVFWL